MRLLDWDGCANVRDLGGLPLAGGGETRHRVLVRADDVTRLSPAGRQALRDYGITTVVDLRCPTEGESLADAVRVPLFRYDDEAFLDAAYACSWRGEFYVLLLEQGRVLFGDAVRALAAAPGTALFHCVAGRDRTGLVSALVLACAGVVDEAILADYAASQAALQARYERRLAAVSDEAERVRIADEHDCSPERMQAALDHLRSAYGGVEAYLQEAGADGAVETIRARLTA